MEQKEGAGEAPTGNPSRLGLETPLQDGAWGVPLRALMHGEKPARCLGYTDQPLEQAAGPAALADPRHRLAAAGWPGPHRSWSARANCRRRHVPKMRWSIAEHTTKNGGLLEPAAMAKTVSWSSALRLLLYCC